MQPEWDNLSKSATKSIFITELEEFDNEFEIKQVLQAINYTRSMSYPTILFICKHKRGFYVVNYDGERTKSSLMNFVNKCRKTYQKNAKKARTKSRARPNTRTHILRTRTRNSVRS